MKRKGSCPVELQHGACGVWLDASALKKRKVQTLTPLRVLNRGSSYLPPTRSPLPCTKQTTISTFFRARQAGERRTSASQKLPAVASSSATLPKGHKLPPLEKQPQDLCFPQPVCAPAQSDTRGEDGALAREAQAEDKGLISLDCLQPLQETGVLEHTGAAVAPLRERNVAQSSGRSRTWQHFPDVAVQTEGWPKLLSSWSDGSVREAAESENVDPQLKGHRTEARAFNHPVAGLCLRPNSKVCKSDYEKGPQESQAELPVPLFSQDSEGNKVISHSFVRQGGKRPLQNEPLWNQSNPSAGLFDASQQLCYDSLFTEDSQGNRVIKH